MPQKFTFCLLVLLGFAYSLHSQTKQGLNSISQVNDSLRLHQNTLRHGIDSLALANDLAKANDIIKRTDSIALANEKETSKSFLKDSLLKMDVEFKPNPKKAVIYSAIMPGLGQFYNRKYWKLPIVVGGYIGIIYAITWNGRMYNDYMEAYKDLATGGDSWKNMVNDPTVVLNDKERYLEIFRNKKNFFRRNRDLAIISAFGVYGLCMLDAYVDAQLYDFDISPDLSMKIMPVIFEPTMFSDRSIGLQMSFTF